MRQPDQLDRSWQSNLVLDLTSSLVMTMDDFRCYKCYSSCVVASSNVGTFERLVEVQ
jgi:hypothetical protein